MKGYFYTYSSISGEGSSIDLSEIINFKTPVSSTNKELKALIQKVKDSDDWFNFINDGLYFNTMSDKQLLQALKVFVGKIILNDEGDVVLEDGWENL